MNFIRLSAVCVPSLLVFNFLLCLNYSYHKESCLKTFEPKHTVFLIDGSSFLYRAYYGVRPLHTSKGMPVQAVFSFCRMIKKLIDTFSPEYLAIVWDSKGKTTRHEMYQDYKATRQAPPSDLFEQKALIVEFARLIGIAQIQQQGIEADDIMHSIAQERAQEGDTTVLITSDKDMGQALNGSIVLYDAFKDSFTDIPAFELKYGFAPSKLPFYFALLGDTSDNIPGVKGIGDKTATELVKEFASLEDLYSNIEKVAKERTKAALLANKDNAFLSHKLFVLQYHPSGLTKEQMHFDKQNWVKARDFFADLDFKSLVKEVDQAIAVAGGVVPSVAKKMVQYQFITVNTHEQLAHMVHRIKEKKAVAIDTETTGLDAMANYCVGISLSCEPGTAYYVPFAHVTFENQLTKEEIVAALQPIFNDSSIKKYFHNAKFDLHVLAQAGLIIKGFAFDTLVAANLIVKEWQRIGLKYLSEYYFDEPMLSYEEVVKNNKYKNFSYVPLELATTYAASDAHQTLRLVPLLEKELKHEKMENLYNEIEFPLISILYEMENRGIYLDVKQLEELNKRVTLEIKSLEAQIILLAGEKYREINLNSPRQIEHLLFVELQLPPQKKSAKGTSYSTDQEVLEALAAIHPIPGLLLRYRELFKLKSTYIDALPTYVNPKTGCVHTTYSQTAVATGRLSSYDPNLQNIPADSSGYGIEIRAAFKPQKGHVFLSADYSQIELRVLAHLSQDKNLIDAFLAGHDIHAQTASRLFDIPLALVSNEQRQIGKRINFSILYGLTPYGLSKDLDIPFKEAKHYIEKYFAQYPGVQEWMEKVIVECKHTGYVQTLWGHRRYVPTIHEKNRVMYEEARRIAINTVAQGTAADIMKIGMINLDRALKEQGLDAHLVLQIHDELLISVAESEKDRVEKLAQSILQSVVEWEIPLLVTTRFGSDWKEVTK